MYFLEFPNADTITRRLKKLMLLIVRHEKEFGSFDFESKELIDQDLLEYYLYYLDSVLLSRWLC
jgi:hypothetical protein